MLRRTRTKTMLDTAASGKDLAVALSRDKKFRKQLLSALGHGAVARRRARRKIGLTAVATRLASDRQLRRELSTMSRNLQGAWGRVEKKRSHRMRTTLLVLGGGATAVGLVQSRGWIRDRVSGLSGGNSSGARTIDEAIEVEVPVATAYNQWTQFEDFPLFMEGVDHVEQLDDTRLHWVATIAGHKAEWDAKILEQHPDQQISWVSEDGKKTRGTVSFESLGPSKTLIRLSMSYKAEGPAEALGSASGLDAKRVRGDLKRFKELIESRGEESGAWRGEVSAGTTETQG
ncbi:MAG TPA: SRPBCC family protein [Gaiellaceae bacterium]|jgi:uncharacterized membrane protein|nr:SRPBCC family protein [Gaiellaceae bacterium]